MKKIKRISILIVFVVWLVLAFDVFAASVDLTPTYSGGMYNGQQLVPMGSTYSPLPNQTVRLTAVFVGDISTACTTAGHKLYRAMVHARDGNVNNQIVGNLEFFASAEATSSPFTYSFSTGPSGRLNAYWATYYCWSSRFPEAVLLSTAACTRYNSSYFSGATTALVCNLSNVKWDKSTAKVGEQVTISVQGDSGGCKGSNISIEVWRGGQGAGNTIETTLTAAFPTTGNTPPFTLTKRWTPGAQEKFAIKVKDTSGTAVWSGDLVVSGAMGSPGSPSGTSASFKNPIGNNTILELVKAVLSWMIKIAVPIAVFVILVAGGILMTAQGNKTRIDQGKKMLTWAVAGLAVIFIGSGFITLIESIFTKFAG